jgi:FkbM family methyltransferase
MRSHGRPTRDQSFDQAINMRYRSRVYRKIFARPFFRKLNTRLFYLALYGLGVLNYENDDVSGERYLVRTWLPKAIRGPKPVFFDVGANVGHYSKNLLEVFPTAFIHAFEPHPRNFMRLLENGFPTERAKCHNMALGDSPGSLTLFDREDLDGSQHASLHKEAIAELCDQKAVEIKVSIETLDEVAEREGIAYIDFLKIDTEGHELAVLLGARRLLRDRRIGHIQFEFNSLNVFSRAFFRDFRAVLHDYDLFRLLPEGLLHLENNVTMTEIFAFQNILAVPRAGRQVPLPISGVHRPP